MFLKGKIDTINDVDVYEFYLSQLLGQCEQIWQILFIVLIPEEPE